MLSYMEKDIDYNEKRSRKNFIGTSAILWLDKQKRLDYGMTKYK